MSIATSKLVQLLTHLLGSIVFILISCMFATMIGLLFLGVAFLVVAGMEY